MGSILAIGMLLAWWMGMRFGMKRTRAVLQEGAAMLERPVAEFRRPVEMGPLHRPWAEIEQMRAAIIADQLGAGVPEGAGRPERAVPIACTDSTERVLFWLQWWEDSGGLFAATGAAA
jgi:hypothetical protein